MLFQITFFMNVSYFMLSIMNFIIVTMKKKKVIHYRSTEHSKNFSNDKIYNILDLYLVTQISQEIFVWLKLKKYLNHIFKRKDTI